MNKRTSGEKGAGERQALEQISDVSEYRIVRPYSVGVRGDTRQSEVHHAYKVSTDEIIYTGTFENCVRAIERRLAEDKAGRCSCDPSQGWEDPRCWVHGHSSHWDDFAGHISAITKATQPKGD